MYWLPKIDKTPAGARFIVASYCCSTNPLPDAISNIFKMIFNTRENFHKKSFFYVGCNKFWVVQNSFPIVTMLKKAMSGKTPFQLLTVAPYMRPSYINSS